MMLRWSLDSETYAKAIKLVLLEDAFLILWETVLLLLMWCKIFSLLEKILDPPPLLFQYRTFYYFITYYTNAGYYFCYWRSSESFKGMFTYHWPINIRVRFEIIICTFGWSQLTDYRLFVASYWNDYWMSGCKQCKDCMKEIERKLKWLRD